MTPSAGDSPEPGLPTGEVARRIGVSPVTIRSWERRYGIGPGARLDGRHRRWTADDIQRLETMCRLTVQGLTPAEAARCVLARRDTGPAPDGSLDFGLAAVGDAAVGLAGDKAARVLARGIVRAACRLDAPTVHDLVDEAIERRGVEHAWAEILTPALRAAGRRWAATGEASVEVEHLLSWHVAAALRSRALCSRALAGGPAQPTAVLAAVLGEDHTLPLDALAALLAERGIGFRMLGASVPTDALVRACRGLAPASVLLWSQSRATANPQAVREVVGALGESLRGAAHRGGLLLGGPGWRALRVPDSIHKPNSLSAAADRMAALQALHQIRPGRAAAGTMRAAVDPAPTDPGSTTQANGGE